MAALTQLSPYGGPGQRYGSFAGKDSSTAPGPHDPGRITQLWPYGSFGGRYGSFAGKEGTTPTPTPTPTPGGDDVPGAHGAYRKGERKRRGLEREPETTREEWLARLQKAYSRAIGETQPDQEVAAAVRPFAVASDTAMPPLEAIDWRALQNDIRAVAILLQRYEEAIDEENAVVLLLLSS